MNCKAPNENLGHCIHALTVDNVATSNPGLIAPAWPVLITLRSSIAWPKLSVVCATIDLDQRRDPVVS